nr:unnamed protein product [Callosobruchus analis]
MKIIQKSHIWLRFPFPCAFGAIHCTHIRILNPFEHGNEHYSRKGYFNINVQTTCNAKEELTSIDAQWPGSVHNSRILKNSAIYAQMNNTRHNNMVLLHNSGYGIRRWMMMPKTREATAFNTFFTKGRVIIERCISQMKVSNIWLDCAVLHSISKYLNDPVRVEQEDDRNDEEEEEYNSENEDENVRRRGLQRREEIKNSTYQLQHQFNYINKHKSVIDIHLR